MAGVTKNISNKIFQRLFKFHFYFSQWKDILRKDKQKQDELLNEIKLLEKQQDAFKFEGERDKRMDLMKIWSRIVHNLEPKRDKLEIEKERKLEEANKQQDVVNAFKDRVEALEIQCSSAETQVAVYEDQQTKAHKLYVKIKEEYDALEKDIKLTTTDIQECVEHVQSNVTQINDLKEQRRQSLNDQPKFEPNRKKVRPQNIQGVQHNNIEVFLFCEYMGLFPRKHRAF